MVTATAPRTQPANPMIPVAPGIKLCAQMPPEPSEEDVQFVKQAGIEHAVVWTNATKASAEYYAERKRFYEEQGITLHGLGNADVHNQDAIVLGGPNQNAKIEEYLNHIRNLGKAGIPYTTYAHMGNGIWSTEREHTRGGAEARGFDETKARAGHWHGKEYTLPLTNGREYTEDEVWKNFEYFIRQVVPVAEEAGVRIGIHPDDPPIPRLGGVPRIFSTFHSYVKALEIADSPNVGVCLCAGCWLEGGDRMGKSVVDAIHHFGKQRKLFKIHFRNVEAPLPHFVETFLDAGYYDMYKIMKALREVDFDGIVIPDHIPHMAGGGRAGAAFCFGYMRALLERANEEVGGQTRV